MSIPDEELGREEIYVSKPTGKSMNEIERGIRKRIEDAKLHGNNELEEILILALERVWDLKEWM